jgi:hypothetical protein
VRRVMAESGARAVVVAGDDLGDLPAFAAATELFGGAGGLHVAMRSAKTPPALFADADLVVAGPPDYASSCGGCSRDSRRRMAIVVPKASPST